ncbi:VWA domain-containing protein [Treponema primitia]|uniref:VWA domain-containing protein n=1 Tax=Treponema primitia TaxID=88058 RepID=UPI00397EA613
MPENADWEPAQYRETNKLLERLNIRISYIDVPGVKGAPLSFSYRAMRGEYCIYIDRKADRPTFMARDLHEKGHILYNHFNRPRTHRQQFEEFFRRNLHSFLARLPPERNLNSKLGTYSTYIYNRFSDIAQAMEINTKLFNEDRKMLSAAPGGPLEGFIFPRETWPEGLDWMSYMSFLCTELNSFLDHIGDGPGKKIKSSDVSAYNAMQAVERRIQDIQETRKTAADADSNAAYEPEIIRHGRTDNYTDTKTVNTVTELRDVKDLVRILRERSLLLKRNRLHTDILYNINRNRFGDILIPRRYRIENYNLNNLCILLDVSGSVPPGFVKRVIQTIMRAEGAFYKGAFSKHLSRLVCWSDSLCSDTSLADIGAINLGGGTVLGAGIEYCKRYLNERSSFFIISDFQDDLNDWISAARDLGCQKTAVGYGRFGRDTSFERWFSAIGSNADYRKNPVDIRRFVSVFDTVLLRDDVVQREGLTG